MLLASGQLQTTITDAIFMGKLSLDGKLRHTNGVLSQALFAKEKNIKQFCQLDTQSLNLLRLAVEKMHLSARSYYRMIKLARTIADLEGSEVIKQSHIAESL